jgi:hypothetical protein
MYNKKVLIDSLKKLGSAKAPTKKPDIIYEPKGQLKYPGQNTRIPSEDITMQGVPYPVLGKPNIGQPQMMQPGQNYQFPGADYVDEYPQMKKGGRKKGLVSMPKPSKKGLMSKKYSRSLDATNKFFTQNYLFAKPKSRKNKVFDPNSKYYAEGGESKCQPDEYWDGKKCVKIPKEFKVINDHNEFVYRNKMYGDSLNLFKAYQMQDKLMGPASYKTKDKYKWNTAELKEGRKKKMMPGLTHLVSADFQSEADQFKGGYNAWTARPEDQKLIRYYKSLGFTDKDIMYHSSPDVVSDKIKAVGSYFDGDAVSPIYKKPVQPVVFQEVDKSVVPTTRTVYIDCPPGSVSNDEKTEVITNDPDSPGNYLRTITTGCELEKIENLPIRKPGLIKQEDSELQGADEYNEALENLEAPSYQPVESYNEHFGRTGSLKHKYDIFIPNKLFKMDVGPGGIRYGKRYPIPKFGMKESTMEDPITGETVNKQFRKDRKIQRETGLDRAYYEGSYDEEGNYIPGELENAETEGRRINFEGQYGRKDRKAQEKYNLEYDEYEFRKKFPTLLDELNITYEDYIKKYVSKKQYGGDTDAMTGMMKARLAYANEFGNPAAKRMINIPDNPYQFDNGDIGTHYMASYDNYAVPQIQDENGVLQLGDYGPESNEAIRFDSDEDADYFAKNYKDVSPAFMELELTPEEIEEYKKGGYIVEEVNDPSIPKLGGFAKGGAQGCPQGTYWNGKKCVDDPFTKGLISQIKKGNKSKKPVPSLTRKAPTQPIPNSWVNSFPSVAEINRQKLKNKQIQNLAEVTITGYKQDFNKVDPEIVPYIYPANTNAARAWEIQKEIFPESVNEINNWYKNWYAGRMENPKFKELATERYNAAVNGNTPFVLDATPSFQTKHPASLASTYVPKVSDPANLPYQNKIIISNAVAPDGQYNVDYNAKFMNPKISNDYFIQEGIHEKSHWDDNNYPQKGISRANISEDKILNKILPKEYLVPNPQGSVYPINGNYDENNIYDPNYNGLSEETLSYQARPTEIRARLNVWRKTNNIDPRRNYSVKEIESIINKNIQNARTDDDYRNIIELYKVIRKNPKILKELNDSYVQNDSQQFDQNQLQYGKYGGSLHKFIEGGAEASWPPKGWPPIGNYKGLLGLVKKIPTVNTFGNALKLPAVNWTTPSIPTLKREFNVEQVLKNQNFFPNENSFLNAVKNATVQEITPEIDATIGYRSGTTTKEQLLELSKTYASYPQYRNEGTIDAIFDGLKSGTEMEMPMVLQFPNGKKRVFSGNTRMDASRQLGINPNVLMLNVPDMTKLANPWQREAFPGLQYKSTMLSNPKGLWTQVAKDGTINVENALKSIEKESAGDVKVELLKETLGENIPKKMDFNLFRKKTQETIIPLETKIVDHSSNYGVNNVGYPFEKRDFFERALEADTLEIAEIEKNIKNAPSITRQLNSWNDVTEDALQSPMMNHTPFDKPIYEAMGPNGFSLLFATLEEAKQQEEITLRTLKEQLKNTINKSYSMRKRMHDLPLENKTVIFSNKDLFGVGSDAHSNPPETLGHIHFLRDADFPDILLATQIQSDPFQSKYYWKYNINNETDALGEEIRRKAVDIESRNDDIAQGMVNGLRIENTNYSKEEWEEKKLINLEEINKLNNDINVLKEKLEPIVKKYTPNYKQKVLLDKNHKKRFFQEFLNYAANRGDVNYIAIPTVETSARIQNYAPLFSKNQPGPESQLLMENSNSFEEFVKKAEEREGLSFQDATEQDKYLLKKGYDLYKKDGTLKGLLNDKRNYKSKHGTVLGNYEEYIKIAKKLGLEIEDVIIKGHTYKKIVIPEDFLKGVGEIDAYKKGGATNKSIEINLTPEEIKKYVNGGYVVEELNDYAGGGSPIWPPGRRKNTTYLTYSPFYGNSLTGQSSNMGYVDNPFSDEESDFFKVNTIRMPQSYIGISGGADPYGRFNHNQGIMQKLGYDAYVGLPYNYDPNNTDYYSNTPSVGGRIRYNNSINNRWLGIPWNKVFVEASGDYSQSDGLNANFSLGTRFDGKKGKTKGYFEPHVGVSGSFGPHGIKPGAYSANALAQYQILTQSNDIPDLESDAINMSDPAIQVLLSDIYNEGIENPLAKGKKQQGAMADIDLGFKTGFEWSPNFLTKHLPGSKIFGDLRYTAQPIRGMFVSGMGENSQSNYGTYNGVETSLSDQSETNKLSFAHQFTGGLGLKVPIGTVKDKIQNIDFTNIRIPKDCMCPDGTKVDKLEDGSCPCDDHQIEECPPCPDGSVPRRLKDGTCPCEKIESYPDPDEWARNPRWLKDGGVSYELGDEVDEDTMKTLKKLGYTFNKI